MVMLGEQASIRAQNGKVIVFGEIYSGEAARAATAW
jgi:uncharacterized protein YegP (UPF0339 family)